MHPKHLAFFYVTVPVLCLALYLHGYFPLKATLPGHAELKNFSFNGKTVVQPSPMFDKLVIILIDALRSDFVLKGNSMAHLGEIMLNNGGVSFEVRAHPPTVTLPRIKVSITIWHVSILTKLKSFLNKRLIQDYFKNYPRQDLSDLKCCDNYHHKALNKLSIC